MENPMASSHAREGSGVYAARKSAGVSAALLTALRDLALSTDSGEMALAVVYLEQSTDPQRVQACAATVLRCLGRLFVEMADDLEAASDPRVAAALVAVIPEATKALGAVTAELSEAAELFASEPAASPAQPGIDIK